MATGGDFTTGCGAGARTCSSTRSTWPSRSAACRRDRAVLRRVRPRGRPGRPRRRRRAQRERVHPCPPRGRDRPASYSSRRWAWCRARSRDQNHVVLHFLVAGTPPGAASSGAAPPFRVGHVRVRTVRFPIELRLVEAMYGRARPTTSSRSLRRRLVEQAHRVWTHSAAAVPPLTAARSAAPRRSRQSGAGRCPSQRIVAAAAPGPPRGVDESTQAPGLRTRASTYARRAPTPGARTHEARKASSTASTGGVAGPAAGRRTTPGRPAARRSPEPGRRPGRTGRARPHAGSTRRGSRNRRRPAAADRRRVEYYSTTVPVPTAVGRADQPTRARR